ncbi:MAG: alpha/beta fold hydrolase [Cytophagales bacterium]|nr:MAG: alpha/beta fold hydrolase [Cytophagales bacterium]
MKILRTPEEAFANLTDYPFEPNYVEIGGIRVHYIDENKASNKIVLMLHGEPTWSYLYRKMIPIVADSGYRVIAPDLVGFGKSDKLTDATAYSYQAHTDWITAFIQELDLKNITLVCQDWGGLIGLRVAAENEDRFKAIVAANTFLPIGAKPSEAFLAWQNYAQTTPVFNIGKIVSGGCVNRLSDAEIAAYNAPFPDDTYKVAARIFPVLVPTSPEDVAVAPNLKAWEVFKNWQKPFLTCFSDSDPITKGGDIYFQKMIPGTQRQAHTTIAQAGHFLQEDKGKEWAEKIVAFLKQNAI